MAYGATNPLSPAPLKRISPSKNAVVAITEMVERMPSQVSRSCPDLLPHNQLLFVILAVLWSGAWMKPFLYRSCQRPPRRIGGDEAERPPVRSPLHALFAAGADRNRLRLACEFPAKLAVLARGF